MKVSKYTFCFDYNENEYYIYNSLSNALVEVDKSHHDVISDAKTTQEELNENSFDSDFWQMLINKRFINDNEKDEFLLYKSMILPLRNQRDFMHLTLAPTMECNFKCFYCFETEKKKGVMSPQIMDSIVKYVKSIKELNSIFLTWFGGEPLMAIPQMELFYKKLRKVYKKEFKSNIITTGYYLTESVIPILQKLQIGSVQITLDGKKEDHNKIKHTPERDDVFSKVLANIDLLTDQAPEINVVFRINLTKKNIGDYVELYKYLSERYAGKNIGISPAFVSDRTGISTNNCFISRDESANYILDLCKTHNIYTPWIRYPKPLCGECAIRDQRAISFDSHGYAYKCWEMIGQEKFAIGQINSDGDIDKINNLLLNRQLYGADPMDDPQCSACEYLPICDGGCPIQRIQNDFENRTNDVCTFYKSHLADFMRIHIDFKKDGLENH